MELELKIEVTCTLREGLLRRRNPPTRERMIIIMLMGGDPVILARAFMGFKGRQTCRCSKKVHLKWYLSQENGILGIRYHLH